jgi:hypothetical protein
MVCSNAIAHASPLFPPRKSCPKPGQCSKSRGNRGACPKEVTEIAHCFVENLKQAGSLSAHRQQRLCPPQHALGGCLSATPKRQSVVHSSHNQDGKQCHRNRLTTASNAVYVPLRAANILNALAHMCKHTCACMYIQAGNILYERWLM